jgi:hypothetical protein
VRVEGLWSGGVATRCLPRALLFPEIVRDRDSGLEPLEAGEALLRLVPDVLLTQPAGSQSHLGVFAALLDQVDCYRVLSGPDLEATASLVADLI